MSTNNRKPWQRHENAESRRQCQLASKKKWAHKDYYCNLCDKTIMISNKSYHLKTKSYLSKLT